MCPDISGVQPVTDEVLPIKEIADLLKLTEKTSFPWRKTVNCLRSRYGGSGEFARGDRDRRLTDRAENRGDDRRKKK